MHLELTTHVQQDYQTVMNGFNQDLFQKLNPPFPPVKLLRFDGSKKGDMVALELNFLLFRQRWTTQIVEDGVTEQEAYFIDEGMKLPFFLSYWRHRHRVLKDGPHASIVDDIHFKTPLRLLDYLLYPIMWLQFAYRRPIYRKVFR